MVRVCLSLEAPCESDSDCRIFFSQRAANMLKNRLDELWKDTGV